ncbi:right-handed parallel beta-helix repeat-containing protein [Streptomyces sp. NPDC001777]|uniref:right-handed parallel beta-helix repeat-containing protein n=1 Tax=Streptomyces sp. NPDC001777 TaxID=3364608 RepID=UPI0036CD3AA7
MTRSKRTTPALATAAAALLTALPLAAPAHAAGTSYHVDNRPGSNCSDSGPATPQQPWCTFTPVNARTFTAGDRILLARGAAWAQGMTLKGSGTATARIELSAYGSGDRPRILKGTSAYGISLSNPSHWAVKNLEVDGRGSPKMTYGVVVGYDETDGIGHENLTFSDLYVHHNHMGIRIGGKAAPAADRWAVKGVRMTGIRGEHNGVSIAFGDGRGLKNFIQDTVLTGLALSNDDGAPAPLAEECPNSLTLQSMTRVTVRDSLVSHAGGCTVSTGTTGIYLGHVADVDLTNNIVAYTRQSGSPDQSGINYEGWTDDVAVRGNLIVGNVRWGVALQGIHAEGPNRNVTVESNTIVENGQPPIASLGDEAPPDGVIRDNLWEGDSLTATVDGGSFADVAVSGNAGPTTGGRVWFAARDFASGQGVLDWRYQYSPDGGTTWTNLSYQAVDDSWRPAAGALPLLKKWQWHPTGGTGQVARVWTAPRDGTVAIRGRAVKADQGGDGVRVRIRLGDRDVLAPRTVGGDDRVGAATSVDSLTVRAGDTLRFIVDAGPAGENAYDTTSWTPVVGYLR